MALIARVELILGLSHDGNGRKFEKGKPQILTSPSEIKYYQTQGGFRVSIINPPEKSKVVAESSKRNKQRFLDEEIDDEEIDDEEIDDEEIDDENETASEEVEDDEDIAYDNKMLENVKKTELKEIAASLGLEVGGTVSELKKRIISATKK